MTSQLPPDGPEDSGTPPEEPGTTQPPAGIPPESPLQPEQGGATPPPPGVPPPPPQYGAPPPPAYGAPPQPGYGAVPPGFTPPPGYVPPPAPGAMPPQQGFGPQPGFPGVDPSAPFGRHPLTGEPYSDKSKMTAGLLQLFLGGVGAGRWYMGDNGIALAQLFTCGGCGIWALIDAIMMLTGKVRDKYGRPLAE